ncbi:MAG: hypothetical protein WDN01_16840 [Rhizomicrobium sp.]
MMNKDSGSFRAFACLTGVVAILGFFLPVGGLATLAIIWAAYLLLHTAVAVARYGIRAFFMATGAIAVVGVLHLDALGGLCLGLWIATALLSICVLPLRGVFAKMFGYALPPSAAGGADKREFVSIAVPGAGDVDAQTVLAEHGLGGS